MHAHATSRGATREQLVKKLSHEQAVSALSKTFCKTGSNSKQGATPRTKQESNQRGIFKKGKFILGASSISEKTNTCEKWGTFHKYLDLKLSLQSGKFDTTQQFRR